MFKEIDEKFCEKEIGIFELSKWNISGQCLEKKKINEKNREILKVSKGSQTLALYFVHTASYIFLKINFDI